MEVIDNLEELGNDDTYYMSITDIWPDNPNKDDIIFEGGDEY